RLEAARRAAPVAPLRTRLTAALGQQQRAEVDRTAAWAEAEDLLGPAPVVVAQPEDEADEPTLFDLPDTQEAENEPRWSRSERSERLETSTAQDDADLAWMRDQADAALADATAVDAARPLEARAREVAGALVSVREEVSRRTAHVTDLVDACAGAPAELAALLPQAAGDQQAAVRAEAERRTVRELEARSAA
ncbi:hypothetical protein, partial [Nocardioides aquaticus]|uniref:hypothetical protein n=1 Tax=Nocardioides aquaticus TaxID=160826 RepID=UPI0031E2AFB6